MKNMLLLLFVLFVRSQMFGQEENQQENNKVYSFVQEKASPIEGMSGFYQNYVRKINRKKFSSTTVTLDVRLKFIVEKDGTFSDIQVLNESTEGLGEEAIRVLKTMPAWNPAKHNGQKVRSSFTLPMRMTLKAEREIEEAEKTEEIRALITVSKVETEYFELKCNDCTVRTGLGKTDFRIENIDNSAEYQVYVIKVPEEIANEFIEIARKGGQDPNATFDDITFLDIPMKEVGFYSYGLRNPYIQIVSFYKNGHFISISVSSSKPELAVKFMNELKQTFKLKL